MKDFLKSLAGVAIFLFMVFLYFDLTDIGKNTLPQIQLKVLIPENIKSVKIGDNILNVDLALTQEAQELGLSFRKSLEENKGMLFVFEVPKKYSFWMKDMNFPIDIIWIGIDDRIVYIKENVKPESFPESFAPSKDSKYVLEAASGFSGKNNLKEGDLVEFR